MAACVAAARPHLPDRVLLAKVTPNVARVAPLAAAAASEATPASTSTALSRLGRRWRILPQVPGDGLGLKGKLDEFLKQQTKGFDITLSNPVSIETLTSHDVFKDIEIIDDNHFTATSDLAAEELSRYIMEQGWEDSEYIAKHCNGFGALKKHLQDYPPQEVSNITGIEVKELYHKLKRYLTSTRT